MFRAIFVGLLVVLSLAAVFGAFLWAVVTVQGGAA